MFKLTVGTRQSHSNLQSKIILEVPGRLSFQCLPSFLSKEKLARLLLVSDGANPPYSTQHISSSFLFVIFPYDRFIVQANRPAEIVY